MSKTPKSLASVNKFLVHAKQLEKVDLIVSYYCRMHALQLALKIDGIMKDPEAKGFLTNLMKYLEVTKNKLPKTSKDECKEHIILFAYEVFQKADDECRSGKATKQTVKTFHAAYCFFDILNYFGDVPEDLQEKRKYAIWKAAEIKKALMRGEKPTPGGFKEEGVDNGEELKEDAVQPAQVSPEVAKPQPSAYKPVPASAPNAFPDEESDPTPSQIVGKKDSGSLNIAPKPTENMLKAVLAAEKLGKHGLSGLRFNDIDSSIEKFAEAIAVLLPYRGQS